MIQATEAIKLILGVGEPLIGRLLLYDALRMRFRELKLRKDPECPVCGEHPTVTELDRLRAVLRRGAGAAAGRRRRGEQRDRDQRRELKERLDRGEDVFVLDVREPHEYQIGRIPGSTLIPLGELAERFTELDANREIVTQCKSGMRSARRRQLPPRARVQERQEPEGRRPGVGRPGRPDAAEVLRDED